jgi:hypothetical protein
MTNELEEARARLERIVADLAKYHDNCTLARAYGGPTMLPRNPIDERRSRQIATDLRRLLSAPKGEVVFTAREVIFFDLAWDLVVAIRGGGSLPKKTPEERADQAAPILRAFLDLRNEAAVALSHTGGGDE